MTTLTTVDNGESWRTLEYKPDINNTYVFIVQRAVLIVCGRAESH